MIIKILTHILLPFFFALQVVLLLVPPVRKLLYKFGIVDKPDARRINTVPIPRGGGFAVFIAYHITLLLWYNIFSLSNFGPWESVAQMKMSIVGGTLLLFIGVIDDVFNIKPLVKLFGQIVVATILYLAGVSFEGMLGFNFPPVIDYSLTVIWYVIIINAFNLIDGMDGLASGLALIGAFGMVVCLLCRGMMDSIVPLIILCGVCLGFLRYNFNPASIFLGDSGSMFLGFVLATESLLVGGKSAFTASIGVALLVVGVPLFDTLLAIWRRSMRAMLPKADGSGKNGLMSVIQPDKEHLHHRLLAMGLSQRRVAWLLYTVNAIFVVTAVLITLFSNQRFGFVFIGLLLVVSILSRHLARVELWNTGRVFLITAINKKFESILPLVYLFFDVLILIFSWCLSYKLALIILPTMNFISDFPLFFCCIIPSLVFGGAYRRVWNKADARDYLMLVVSILLGWTIACSLSIIFGIRTYGFNRQAFIFLIVMILPLLVIRMIRIFIVQILFALESRRINHQSSTERILVYGAGDRFLMLERYITSKDLGNRDKIIVGIVDDNPLLFRRKVRGYMVLGGVGSIERIIDEVFPSMILVTADLLPQCQAILDEVVRRRGIPVSKWVCKIDKVYTPETGDEQSKIDF